LFNPFGTLYNPYSIFNLIERSISKNPLIEDESLVYHQGVYRCLYFHSAVSDPVRERLVEKAGAALLRAGEFITRASWMILTFGTARVYEYIKTGAVVANCHKLPSGLFRQKLMSVEEIASHFNGLYAELRKINKNINIILTLSPVRHLKDGFEENQISKSILRMACHSIIKNNPEVSYFPAYEIMMDDLRDYRFYDNDLVHPNAMAIQYIWEKFLEMYFEPETRMFITDWTGILKALEHRPFHPDTEEYRIFVGQTIKKLETFRDRVDISHELDQLNSRI
jgi:hypothetical protein